MHLDQISFNQATAETSDTIDVLTACQRAGIGQVSLWRHKYDGSASRTQHLVHEHGLRVSSLCRGGFFTGTRTPQQALDDNQAAIEEAATLHAPTLVLVCGPLTEGNLHDAEQRILDGIQQLLPAAHAAGVKLAVEPFHPMFMAERSAIVTLAQANRLVEEIDDPAVGIALDTYHVWWDPQLFAGLSQAAGRILAVHVADWLVPTPDLPLGRGLPGDGVIPLAQILGAIDTIDEPAGFAGPVEVEVLNSDVWAVPVLDLVGDVRSRMDQLLKSSRAGGAATENSVTRPVR